MPAVPSTLPSLGFLTGNEQASRFVRLGTIIGLHLGLFYVLQNQIPDQSPQTVIKEISASLIPAQPASPPALPQATAQPKPRPAPPKVQEPVPKPKLVIKKPAPSLQAPVAAPPAKPTIDHAVSQSAPAVALPADPPLSLAAPGPSSTASAQPVPPATPKLVSGVEYIQAPPPEYPSLSRRMEEEGTVLLRILVNERGRTEQVELQRSSGFPRLDDAAQKVVWRYVFKPYQENRSAVPVFVIIPIKFSIE